MASTSRGRARACAYACQPYSSGFIALHACLGSRDVDCVLVPEVDFELEGDHGLFAYLERRILEKGYVNVVSCASMKLS